MSAALVAHPLRPMVRVPPTTAAVQAIAFILLAAVIPAADVGAAAAQSPIHWTYTLSVDLAITVYSGARIAASLDGARPRYLGIVFFVFAYVWMGLAAIAQAASQTWPWGIVLSQGVQLQGALLVAIGVLSYDVGRLLQRIFHHAGKATYPGNVRRLSEKRTVLLGWTAVITSPVAVYTLGGLAAQFQNRDAALSALYPAGVINGIVQQPVLLGALARDGWTVLAFIAIYALLVVMRERRRDELPAKVSYRVLLACLIGVNIVVNSPLANARYWLGTMFIALWLLLPFSLRRSGKVAFVACILVGTAVVFPYGNVLRTADGSASIHSFNVGQAFETQPDYDASFMVEATVQYVQTNGLSWGRQLLGAAAFVVPRQVWPTKPTDTGYLLGYFLGTGTPNVSAPLWAEGFVDFGWLGAAAYLLLFGYWSARLDRSWGERASATDFGRVLSAVLAGYSIFILRGALLPAMGSLTVIAFLLWLLCPKKTRSSGARRLRGAARIMHGAQRTLPSASGSTCPPSARPSAPNAS
jgi:hypothetical protein